MLKSALLNKIAVPGTPATLDGPYATVDEFFHAVNRERRMSGSNKWIYFSGEVAGHQVQLKTFGCSYLQIYRVDGANKSLPPMDSNVTAWKNAILAPFTQGKTAAPGPHVVGPIPTGGLGLPKAPYVTPDAESIAAWLRKHKYTEGALPYAHEEDPSLLTFWRDDDDAYIEISLARPDEPYERTLESDSEADIASEFGSGQYQKGDTVTHNPAKGLYGDKAVHPNDHSPKEAYLRAAIYRKRDGTLGKEYEHEISFASLIKWLLKYGV